MSNKKIVIIGSGSIHGFAAKNILSSIALGEPVHKKEFDKTEEEKKVELLNSIKTVLPNGFIEEYELIQQKKSKLSRAKRDYIVREVEKHFKQPAPLP